MFRNFYEALSGVPGLTLLNRPQEIEPYCPDTGGAMRYPAGVLQVSDASAVPRILAAANAHRVPLWPISGGRNFGYGTAQPVAAGSVVVDLSPLKRIEIDTEAAIARIEPGVTQHDLERAIRRAGARLLVPTTGVGPNGNILGTPSTAAMA